MNRDFGLIKNTYLTCFHILEEHPFNKKITPQDRDVISRRVKDLLEQTSLSIKEITDRIVNEFGSN